MDGAVARDSNRSIKGAATSRSAPADQPSSGLRPSKSPLQRCTLGRLSVGPYDAQSGVISVPVSP